MWSRSASPQWHMMLNVIWKWVFQVPLGYWVSPNWPSSLLSSGMLCLSQREGWSRRAFLIQRMAHGRCGLPCGVALSPAWGSEGRKVKHQFSLGMLNVTTSSPRARRIYHQGISTTSCPAVLVLVIGHLHSLDKPCILSSVSETSGFGAVL